MAVGDARRPVADGVLHGEFGFLGLVLVRGVLECLVGTGPVSGSRPDVAAVALGFLVTDGHVQVVGVVAGFEAVGILTAADRIAVDGVKPLVLLGQVAVGRSVRAIGIGQADVGGVLLFLADCIGARLVEAVEGSKAEAAPVTAPGRAVIADGLVHAAVQTGEDEAAVDVGVVVVGPRIDEFHVGVRIVAQAAEADLAPGIRLQADEAVAGGKGIVGSARSLGEVDGLFDLPDGLQATAQVFVAAKADVRTGAASVVDLGEGFGRHAADGFAGAGCRGAAGLGIGDFSRDLAVDFHIGHGGRRQGGNGDCEDFFHDVSFRV